MSTSRIFFPLALAALSLGTSGCDTLKARARAQQGVEKYRDGDIKEAARLFREAAEIDPTVPPILINRGFTHLALYQQNPRSKEGQEAADLAVRSFRDYMALPTVRSDQRQRARDYLLQTFVDARKYDEAVEFFKPQVERENPDLEALTILGNIAKSIGKMDASRMWLERRIKANPKDTDGYVALAIMTWDDLCADTQCRMAPEQRKNNLQMPPLVRIEKANAALELLEKARLLSPKAPTPVIYANLLLRERSYAQPTDDLKRTDLEEANKLLQIALAMQKAATGTGGDAAPAGAAKPAAAAPAAPTAAPAAPTAAAPATPPPAPPAAVPPPPPPAPPALPAPPPKPKRPAAPKAAPAPAPAAPAAAPSEAPAAAPAPAPEPEKKPAEAPPPPPPPAAAGASEPAASEKQ
ncbi:MAG: hypothetical protein U1A78_21850 [Polyangia bacterium]